MLPGTMHDPCTSTAAGKPVVLLSTPVGQEGVAVLGDVVSGQEDDVHLVSACAAGCMPSMVETAVHPCL